MEITTTDVFVLPLPHYLLENELNYNKNIRPIYRKKYINGLYV